MDINHAFHLYLYKCCMWIGFPPSSKSTPRLFHLAVVLCSEVIYGYMGRAPSWQHTELLRSDFVELRPLQFSLRTAIKGDKQFKTFTFSRSRHLQTFEKAIYLFFIFHLIDMNICFLFRAFFNRIWRPVFKAL